MKVKQAINRIRAGEILHIKDADISVFMKLVKKYTLLGENEEIYFGESNYHMISIREKVKVSSFSSIPVFE